MHPRTLLQAIRHFKAEGINSALNYLREVDHNHLKIVSHLPAIVYAWWGREDEALHHSLRKIDFTLLYLFPWCYLPSEADQIAAKVKQRLASYTKHRIIFLCNEEYAVEDLRKRGVEAAFIHQNAFINENLFEIRPDIEPTHDAIYNASMAPYKRHALAAEVGSLMLLAYTYGGSTNARYAEQTRQLLAHAWWAKDSRNDSEKLPTERIVDLYARARTGLCLSESEGGMFVSMEYLLCGLGVVSTPSTGGRDAFWDERFVVLCEATPKAVSRAVQELCERRIPREQVRQSTLERVQTHRDRFQDLLKSMGATCSLPWEPGSHGISSFRSLHQVGREIMRGRP